MLSAPPEQLERTGMESIPVAITGVCAPERHLFAERAAASLGRRLVWAYGGPRHTTSHRPQGFWAGGRDELALFDCATDLDPLHFSGAFDTPPALVCVIDAPHMIQDLRDGSALRDDAPPGDDRGDHGARARQAAAFVEAAHVIAFVNWEGVETARLAMLMALASHLNPLARIRLTRNPHEDVRAALAADTSLAVGERAGWVRMLNEEHDPHMTDRRVTTFRYEQLRPFHPERLMHALDDEIDARRWGLVLRSVGFCRLATRPGMLARWEQVGSAMWLDPLHTRDAYSCIGQEIALTGLDLNTGALARALDAAALTDAEMDAGPEAWERFADPLPAWPVEA
jgi:hypothetical protein